MTPSAQLGLGDLLLLKPTSPSHHSLAMTPVMLRIHEGLKGAQGRAGTWLRSSFSGFFALEINVCDHRHSLCNLMPFGMPL